MLLFRHICKYFVLVIGALERGNTHGKSIGSVQLIRHHIQLGNAEIKRHGDVHLGRPEHVVKGKANNDHL